MTSGEDWLFRPVLKGIVRLESLQDGSISLLMIAKINEAIDVEIENQRRVSER